MQGHTYADKHLTFFFVNRADDMPSPLCLEKMTRLPLYTMRYYLCVPRVFTKKTCFQSIFDQKHLKNTQEILLNQCMASKNTKNLPKNPRSTQNKKERKMKFGIKMQC